MDSLKTTPHYACMQILLTALHRDAKICQAFQSIHQAGLVQNILIFYENNSTDLLGPCAFFRWTSNLIHLWTTQQTQMVCSIFNSYAHFYVTSHYRWTDNTLNRVGLGIVTYCTFELNLLPGPWKLRILNCSKQDCCSSGKHYNMSHMYHCLRMKTFGDMCGYRLLNKNHPYLKG